MSFFLLLICVHGAVWNAGPQIRRFKRIDCRRRRLHWLCPSSSNMGEGPRRCCSRWCRALLCVFASPPAHAAIRSGPGPISSYVIVALPLPPLVPPCFQSPCVSASCRAFTYHWVSCCDCWECARNGCCFTEVKDAPEGGYGAVVSNTFVDLFDLL